MIEQTPQSLPKLKLLLSEDREDDALLIVDELMQSGYEVEWKRVETPRRCWVRFLRNPGT